MMRTSSFGVLADADRRLVWRDPLLKWVLLLPFGLALLLRILIPQAHETLLRATGVDIAPYYPLIMGGYLMTAPGIAGMVIGFLLLDERDARTLTALRVTPVSIRRYLAYRISGPLLVGTATTLLGYALIEITPLPFGPLLAISVVVGMSAPLIALVLATAAPNKVAGLAVVKVLNGVNLLPIAAYFLPRPAQYLAGVIPTYWPMRAFWSAAQHESYSVYLGIGCLVGLFALAVAARLFERQLLRRA
jgi:fluoroquinolone transport system permease protein